MSNYICGTCGQPVYDKGHNDCYCHNCCKPQRIQLKRIKGFNIQEYSKSLNGLEAVKCDRNTKWGNPFKIYELNHYYLGRIFAVYKNNMIDRRLHITDWSKEYLEVIDLDARYFDVFNSKQEAIEKSIELFEELIKNNDNFLLGFDIHRYGCKSAEENMFNRIQYDATHITSRKIIGELKGKNLASYESLNQPSHIDVLLKIANED